MTDRHDDDRLTLAQCERWITAARPGARLVYGCGAFAPDAAGPEVAIWFGEMAEAGLVQLFQKRIGPSRFDYIAVRGRLAFTGTADIRRKLARKQVAGVAGRGPNSRKVK